MSLREDLAGVLARDSRYTIQAYAFLFEALEFTKIRKRRAQVRSLPRRGRRVLDRSRHVSPRELCEGARDLALSHYGLLAMTVLGQWGIRSTSDLGEIVFNLIASGDLTLLLTNDRQEAPPAHPTLRTHRLAIGLFDRTGETLRRRDRLDLEVTGAATGVPELFVVRAADLLLPNDDDLERGYPRHQQQGQGPRIGRPCASSNNGQAGRALRPTARAT